jgi:hypothetical protein
LAKIRQKIEISNNNLKIDVILEGFIFQKWES